MRSDLAIIIIALVSVSFGMWQVFFKDAVWAFHAHSEWLMGTASQRTKQWDRWTEIGGWAVIVAGIALLVLTILTRVL